MVILPDILLRIITYGLFCLVVLASAKEAFAQDYYFNEEFDVNRPINTLDSDKWVYYPNSSCGGWPNISETSGYLSLSQCLNTAQFPYVVSKVNPFPQGNWQAEIALQYTRVTPWGTGMALAEEAAENGGKISPLLDISIWQDYSLANLRVGFDDQDVYATTVSTDPHVFKVERLGQKYYLYFDNNLIYTSEDTNKEVKFIWLGNPTSQNPRIPRWTDFKLDYIRVSKIAPSTPVIFIPGIGGSEFQLSQEVFWQADDGHGGEFIHGYDKDEKIWVNEGEAAKLGDDDYFDILRLENDGVTPVAPAVTLTGNLVPFGYAEIDSFFKGLDYEKGKSFFVFPYDWRKDIRLTKDSLDALIEQAKLATGATKVNIVAHSMGGLVARYYISDPQKAKNVNKLISLGVPHLGAPDALKMLVYGKPLGRPIVGDFYIGVTASASKDVSKNFPSVFELLPSKEFYTIYDNSDNKIPYPFRDDRDIDNNKEVGPLNFSQTKSLLSNLSHNITVFNIAESFRSDIDPLLNQNNGVKLHHIIGSGQPTLGQIIESWLITWPIKLFSKRDYTFIDGDGTVPTYSASLKSPNQDLSSGASIYYVEQKHSNLVNKYGAAMQTVKNILSELDPLPAEAKTEKIALEGQQITVDQEADLDLYDEDGKHTGLKDNGEVETNITDTFFEPTENTTHAFVKKKANKVKAKVSSKKAGITKVNVKLRHYAEDKVVKTTIYKDVPIVPTAKVEINIDPQSDLTPVISLDDKQIPPTSEVEGDKALDQEAPQTKVELTKSQGGTTVTMTASDSGAGVLQTEYSLDNGQTVQTYTQPFTITTAGTTNLQVKSIDKLGNEEYPQTITVSNEPSPTPTATPSQTQSFSNSTTASSATGNTEITSAQATSQNTTSSQPVSLASVLGIKFNAGKKQTKELEKQEVLGKQSSEAIPQPASLPKQTLQSPSITTWLLLAIPSLALLFPQTALLLSSLISNLSLLKPTPK